MGRSKSAPVQRQADDDSRPDEYLGRRVDNISPDELLRIELEQNRDNHLSIETPVGNDAHGNRQVVTHQIQSPSKKSIKKKPPKKVSFANSLVTEIELPEIVISYDDDDDETTVILCRLGNLDSCTDDTDMFLLRVIPLPNTRVELHESFNESFSLPSSITIDTSLCVLDLWKRFSLSGHTGSAVDIVASIRQSFLRVDIKSHPSPRILVHITSLALQVCNVSNLPVTLNNPVSRQLIRAELLRRVLASFFHELNEQRPVSRAPDLPARQVYKVTDNAQLKASSEINDCDRAVPGLLPKLRPYQRAAVDWMLQREKNPVESKEWELAWIVLNEKEVGRCTFLPEWTNGNERSLFYNQFTGWLATTYEEAKIMSIGENSISITGGILAESMGLGKTVELLACILEHRRYHPDHGATSKSVMSVSTPSAVEICHDNTELPNSSPFSDLMEFGDAELSSDDEEAELIGPGRQVVSTSLSETAFTRAIPVTPEKATYRRRIQEHWTEMDEIGSCICGQMIGFGVKEQNVILCRSCKEPMHLDCAFFTSETDCEQEEQIKYRQKFTNRTIHCIMCSERSCPCCVALDERRIESGATLIVTPAAIIDQWNFEIARHTSQDSRLKVVVYEGVKACQSKRKSYLLHPSLLANADIVLMTFDSLMSDLGHSDENRFVNSDASDNLRNRKRYRVIPSPLIGVEWWRVILDEAQKVETPTAASAKMALKLRSCQRWAVTGTPLGRGRVDDLYGLLLFLRLSPFHDKQLFNRCLQPGYGDLDKRLIHLLNNVMWRSTKSLPAVAEQLGIPEQVEKKTVLCFSSIEKHFYNQQLEDALSSVSDMGRGHMKGKKRNAVHLSAVTDRLYRLRAACCHPQVGSNGISAHKRQRRAAAGPSDSVSRRVMTMEEILVKFIDEARLKCEESQRLVVMHRNAVAAISRLKVEARGKGVTNISESDEELLSKSRDLYLDSLDQVKANSTPTLVLGECVVTASTGLSLTTSIVKNGVGLLVWKFMESIPCRLYAAIDFIEAPKKVTQLRLCPVVTVPSEISNEAAEDYEWNIIYPKDCVLQVQVNSIGDEYVDVVPFYMPPPTGDGSDAKCWTVVTGFLTNKSKSWRVQVESFHDCKLSNSPESKKQSFGVVVGLQLELFEANIDNDPIQRLHALTNAVGTCQSIVELVGRSPKDAKSAHDQISTLQSEATQIESLYLDRARCIHRETKRKFEQTLKERKEKEESLYSFTPTGTHTRKIIDCWDERWWHDFLAVLHLRGSESQKDAVLTKLAQDLEIYMEGNGHNLVSRGIQRFPRFAGIHGFMTALEFRISAIRSGIGRKELAKTSKNGHAKKSELGAVDGVELFQFRSTRFKVAPGQHDSCMNAILALSPQPSSAEIYQNSNCSVCKADWFKTGTQCQHCNLGAVLEDLTPDEVTEKVMRVLYDIMRSNVGVTITKELGGATDVVQRSKSFFDLLEAQKREKVAAYRMWRVHLDLLNDLDELNQVKSSIRLSYDGENLTLLNEDEKNAVVQPVDIHRRYHEHAAKEAMAQGDLRRALEKLRYLQSLLGGESDESECPICLNAFSERAVLRCGHSLCRKCLEDLRSHSKEHRVSCPKKCSIRTDPDDILLASNESKTDGTSCKRAVKGSYGTKVTHLVAEILDLRDSGDKGVVFSQWEDMLDIVQSALVENEVSCIRAGSRRDIGDSVSRFRSPGVTVLLLNVKNGAEGLTLLEATHVYIIEPWLNTALDSQAISRVLRIGQRRRTYVHRYLMKNTIEMKIDKLREEHQQDEEAIEESLNVGRKAAINAGGIDGGFGSEQEVMDLLAID